MKKNATPTPLSNFAFTRRLWLFYALTLFFLAIFQGCKSQSFTDYTAQKSVLATKAAIAAAHPLATQAGIETLKKGGNAADAAITVQFALAVVYPRAGNLGGGGFFVYRPQVGEPMTLDYREKAPLKAHRDMYLDKNGEPLPNLSQKGHLAAGVPGTVEGCIQIFERYSKLRDWKKLVQPAIELAERGFAITEGEANRLNNERETLQKYGTRPSAFVKPNGEKWKTGDILQQPELAETLKRIRDLGRAGFYEGKTADLIVAEMQRGKGIISHDDLKKYKAAWRKPLVGKYRGYELICMPPPSSGGVALLQLLSIVENYPLSTYGFHSPQAMHLFIEAERRVYADRAKHLGDPDFYKVDIQGLLHKNYLNERFKNFDAQHATPSKDIAAGKIMPQSEQTTHFSIVDEAGNAVAVTTTLNDNYGCRTVVGGAGFLLNNEMDDFSIKPGTPNMYGAIGGEANAIVAEKRMLSSMTPTIVAKDGKLFMVVGTPGGTTIITSVFQVVTNVIDFNMSATEATHAKRFHSQWLPDHVFIEKADWNPVTLETLRQMGHNLKERAYIGLVETILVRADGKLEAAADNRSDDDARGY